MTPELVSNNDQACLIHCGAVVRRIGLAVLKEGLDYHVSPIHLTEKGTVSTPSPTKRTDTI